jgi:hypothetical protein
VIGRCVEMRVDAYYIPHLVVDVADDELLQAWAISTHIHRRWFVLLNLETGRTDVWAQRDVEDACRDREWL